MAFKWGKSINIYLWLFKICVKRPSEIVLKNLGLISDHHINSSFPFSSRSPEQRGGHGADSEQVHVRTERPVLDEGRDCEGSPLWAMLEKLKKTKWN